MLKLSESILEAQKKLVPVSRQAAAEGIVLLENRDATLPLTAGETVSLFGRCQIDTYRSGTGSGGAVNVPYAVNALQGLRENSTITVNETLAQLYQDWIAEHPFDDGGGGWAAEPWFQQEMPLTDETVAAAARASSKAIVFIGRTAGEDQDNADAAGSYRLTDDETAMIEQVSAAFDTVILVLNVTNIIDLSWLDSINGKGSIKAVLFNWAAGMEGGHALADILSGKVSPSGHLTDTIAWQLEDYPSSANFGDKQRNIYVEDIYVGYRYFETFKPEAVQYPFGYGLSYTQFQLALTHFEQQNQGSDLQLNFEVSVTNSGTHHGKKVVQLYVAAPQGKLGKPARSLVGFAKTEELAPGQQQTVQIQVTAAELASFDDSGITGLAHAYVLEAGEYKFYLGDDVRAAQGIDATLVLTELQLIEQLQEALAPLEEFERIKPTEFSQDRYRQAFEAVPRRTVDMARRIHDNLPPNLPLTGDQGIRLIDVKEGRASMEDFVAQLSEAELATLVRGEGMCSPKVTPGTASAFGGVSNSLFRFGIPVAAAADGPSGIRMDSGHKATQVPIGTLLACTWNIELNRQLFQLVGEELLANQIDTLLGPGINIHRHPLNGRNFEYFSEDPFMTGVMAAAQTLGLAEAGVSGTVKHFAANDQETARTKVDSIMSARALREIHLKPFELAVKRGRASTIMTAYNPINGHWSASNYDLNTTILRGEWGYTGIVMTDWWAKMNHPVDGGTEDVRFTSYMVRAQNDLYMVVANDRAEANAMNDNTLEALADGSLTVGELQRSAMNICRFINNAPVMSRPLQAYEPVKSFAARQPAAEQAQPVTEPLTLNTKTNIARLVEVTEAGEYQVSASVHFDRDAQAQSSCSLYFNGEFSQSLFVNGTDGKPQTVTGLKVKLEPGLYELVIDFVKRGLQVDTLSLSRV